METRQLNLFLIKHPNKIGKLKIFNHRRKSGRASQFHHKFHQQLTTILRPRGQEALKYLKRRMRRWKKHQSKTTLLSINKASWISLISLLKMRKSHYKRKNRRCKKRRLRSSNLTHLMIKIKRLKIFQSLSWLRSKPRWRPFARKLKLRRLRLKLKLKLNLKRSSVQVLRKWSKIKWRPIRKPKNLLKSLTS